MFDYIDAIPDLQFMSIFVFLLVVIYLIEWATDRMGRGKQ